MRRIKKLILSIFIVFSAMTLVVNTVPTLEQTITVQAASVRISQRQKTLKVGSKVTLKITGTKKKVKWSSSNKRVATVNSKGRVTAKKKGKATITAKVGKTKYKCYITVKSKNTTSSVVYITRTGSKYHRGSCSYLWASKIKTTLSSARSRGYTACSRCF